MMFFYCRVIVVLALFFSVASTVSHYPHQLAYFNELAGGQDNGHKHLLHSGLNYGQDLRQLPEEISARFGEIDFLVYYFEYTCPLYLTGIECVEYSNWLRGNGNNVTGLKGVLVLERTVASLVMNAPPHLLSNVQLRLRDLVGKSRSCCSLGATFVGYVL